MTVRIAGYGWVGKAMHKLFPDALITDPAINRNDEGEADVLIVCVPTPNFSDGSLDTRTVAEVVDQATEDLIIIRSTINPGDCDEWDQKKNIVFMPEYLGETVAHPLIDDKIARFLIIGGRPENRRKAIELWQTVYNANIKIRQLSLKEAEVVKLSENRAIMFKVAQSQELYDACEAAGVDYYTIREAVYGDDPRFSLDFTFVYPDKRGANSKCIPKDVLAWAAWAELVGFKPLLTNKLLAYNHLLVTGERAYDAKNMVELING